MSRLSERKVGARFGCENEDGIVRNLSFAGSNVAFGTSSVSEDFDCSGLSEVLKRAGGRCRRGVKIMAGTGNDRPIVRCRGACSSNDGMMRDVIKTFNKLFGLAPGCASRGTRTTFRQGLGGGGGEEVG